MKGTKSVSHKMYLQNYNQFVQSKCLQQSQLTTFIHNHTSLYEILTPTITTNTDTNIAM